MHDHVATLSRGEGCRREMRGSRQPAAHAAMRPMRAAPPTLCRMDRKNRATGTISRIEARKYLLVAVGLAARCWRRPLASEEEVRRVAPPCALTKKIRKATKATARTSVDQISRRRGSSLGGREAATTSELAGGAQVADHEAGPCQQAGDEHLGERGRDQPRRVDEVLVPKVPGRPENEQKQEQQREPDQRLEDVEPPSQRQKPTREHHGGGGERQEHPSPIEPARRAAASTTDEQALPPGRPPKGRIQPLPCRRAVPRIRSPSKERGARVELAGTLQRPAGRARRRPT